MPKAVLKLGTLFSDLVLTFETTLSPTPTQSAGQDQGPLFSPSQGNPDARIRILANK